MNYTIPYEDETFLVEANVVFVEEHIGAIESHSPGIRRYLDIDINLVEVIVVGGVTKDVTKFIEEAYMGVFIDCIQTVESSVLREGS